MRSYKGFTLIEPFDQAHGKLAVVRKRKSEAFTLIELLVVIAIIALLVAILLPSLGRAKDLAKRAACASGLNTIGKEMFIYANDYDDAFPNAEPTGTSPNCIGTYVSEDRTGTNGSGNSRSLFLLVKGGYSMPKAFICPATQDTISEDMDVEDDYDFRRYDNLSYSYQVQKNNSTSNYYNPTTTLSPGGLCIMADRNPMSGKDTDWVAWGGGHYTNGAISRSAENSFNHGQDGQNILRADAGAFFADKPTVGIDGDSIWCWEAADGSDSTGDQDGAHPFKKCSPTNIKDSFLWP